MSKWKDKVVDGMPVRVYDEVSENQTYPILGAVFNGISWVPTSWTSEGINNISKASNLVKDIAPWSLETFPVPFPVIKRKCGFKRYTVLTVGIMWVTTSERDLTYSELLEQFVCTFDGKTWQECGV